MNEYRRFSSEPVSPRMEGTTSPVRPQYWSCRYVMSMIWQAVVPPEANELIGHASEFLGTVERTGEQCALLLSGRTGPLGSSLFVKKPVESGALFTQSRHRYRGVAPFPIASLDFQRGLMWIGKPDLPAARARFDAAQRRVPAYAPRHWVTLPRSRRPSVPTRPPSPA